MDPIPFVINQQTKFDFLSKVVLPEKVYMRLNVAVCVIELCEKL